MATGIAATVTVGGTTATGIAAGSSPFNSMAAEEGALLLVLCLSTQSLAYRKCVVVRDATGQPARLFLFRG